ncbi:DUF2889 domain-containing protein [Aeromicrobium sp. UC242_57]|uniref:DUF2889 domain-containing protein n=1 Tax=Aeromicrobium sp. UC242_57 TaxID=3374624 RepID=UPI0037BBED3D
MPDVPAGRRRSRRTKQLDLVPEDDGSFTFHASLVDESFGGNYESGADSLVIHHFVIDGRVGDDLTLLDLSVEAEEHPFPQCPFVLPAAQDLIGLGLSAGWRRTVLDAFRGSAGCTHVTTLLLGLSEVVTLIYFQRMNRGAAYGPHTRASGEWIAGSLDLAPDLGGACHALAEDGPVLRQAARFRHRGDRADDLS